jgi:DNA-directed RNA polymerase specialized sigma24 family protein
MQTQAQVSPVDRLGRPIDPVVLRAAEELSPRLLMYCEKIAGDPAMVANLLEESAAAVSRVFQARKGPPIRDIHAYLYRAVVRKVNKGLRRSPRFANGFLGGSVDLRATLDRKLLIDELLRSCDPIIREMFYRRVQGFSWGEIGNAYGISAHSAESRFGQALQRIRKRVDGKK